MASLARTAARTALIVTGLALAAPGAAGAANVTTDCNGIQSALTAANNGDVITINQSPCVLSAGLALPADKNAPFAITLQGSGAGAVLDGTNLPAGERILTGNVTAPKTLDLTLRNITFQNSKPLTVNGGALLLIGNVGAVLDRDRFFGNSSAYGGGAYISVGRPVAIRNSVFGGASAAAANFSAGPGGLYASTFQASLELRATKFIGNKSSGGTGGASIIVGPAAASVTVADNFVDRNVTDGASSGGLSVSSGVDVQLLRNRITGNRVNAIDALEGGAAGGLEVNTNSGGLELTQRANVIDGNRVNDNSSGSNFRTMGGGEEIGGYDSIVIRGDRFTNNTIAAPRGNGEAAGAGLSLRPCGEGANASSNVAMQNVVAAGNTGLGETEGAGVYVGCTNQPAHLTMVNSTVSGNTAAGGDSSGLEGDADDTLVLRNSIVTRNTGAADVAGFSTRTVTESDACSGAAPLAGAGNICANPLLVNPGPGHADVHQRPTSPTIDAGLNSLVPAGLLIDFEGQKRILYAVVDMGADEYLDRVAPVLSKLSIAPAKVAPDEGTQLFYRLSEAARVKFTVQRRAKGRKVGGKCVRRKESNKGKPPCRRWVKVGKLPAQTAKAGKNIQSFAARVGGKKLKPGSYRVALVATDARANRSTTKRVRFVVRKP